MNDKSFLPPEERRLADELEALAERLTPRPTFTRNLEATLMNAHSPEPKRRWLAQALSALGGTVALILLALTLNWLIRSIAPQPQPAAGGTPSAQPPTPTPIITSETVTAPSEKTYDWHGTPLTLGTNLPGGEEHAFIFEYQDPQPATLESARALAAQFGMDGPLYGNAGALLMLDGNQRLSVSSSQNFEFFPDYPRYPAWRRLGNSPAVFPNDAEEQIRAFLQEKGYDPNAFAIWQNDLYASYFALPLTPDGAPICYEYFRCAGMRITLDKQGVVHVEADLPAYRVLHEPLPIISAEEALQKALSNQSGGVLEGFFSPAGNPTTWYRPYPLDQSVTLYGWLNRLPSAEGSDSIVLLDGFPATGNVADAPPGGQLSRVQGRFRQVNGTLTFEVESWQPTQNFWDGLLGTITRQPDGSGLLITTEGKNLILPDLPASVPDVVENAYVLGTRQGQTFDWVSIDLRMQGGSGGGGGGGGGGLGFYKINLSGTPVPFPTPTPRPAPQSSSEGQGGVTYTVQEGDTLVSIAARFGTSVEAIVQANGISDPATIYPGQMLVIPVAGTPAPQRVEGLRGLLSITIYKNADGTQRIEYGFSRNDTQEYLVLEGENLEALQAYQYRPVDIWGTLEFRNGQAPVLQVERYEIPFPNLQFQTLRGKQQLSTVEGRLVALLISEDGQTYAQLDPLGAPTEVLVGQENDTIEVDALLIPGETFGSYPALRAFAAFPTGAPHHEFSPDQIPVIDVPDTSAPPRSIAMAVIERAELVYYMPDPARAGGTLSGDQRYIQPAWLFSGHYNDGSEFFILVQALKAEYLLPELAPYTQPG
jgi:LysM repeat protein